MAGATLGVCLIGATTLFAPVEQFTLAWVHSIERVRWEEDYRVVPGTTVGTPPTLRATGARIRGSAAGMEPPEDAVLRDGWYVYTPRTVTPDGLTLTRSPYTADYQWCVSGRCRPLGELIPAGDGTTRLEACVGGPGSGG